MASERVTFVVENLPKNMQWRPCPGSHARMYVRPAPPACRNNLRQSAPFFPAMALSFDANRPLERRASSASRHATGTEFLFAR